MKIENKELLKLVSELHEIPEGAHNIRQNGKLISKDAMIKASKFTAVEFVMLSNSYGIKTKQLVKGFDNLDILDEIQVLWKYENGKWIPCEAQSVNVGNLLY